MNLRITYSEQKSKLFSFLNNFLELFFLLILWEILFLSLIFPIVVTFSSFIDHCHHILYYIKAISSILVEIIQ